MSVIVRGIKNTSRNWIRSGAVVFILAIGIGMALSMLVANQAVNSKIADLKSNMGNTLSINPAGGRGSEGGGEPLKTADADAVKSVAHVASVETTLRMILRNQDSDDSNSAFGFRMNGSGGATAGKTSLQSAIELGTLGRRAQGADSSSESVPNISLPVDGAGISGSSDQSGKTLNITDGTKLNGQENTAVVGKALADKNSLKVGSTFTAYDTTIKVVGIFDQGTKFDNAGFYVPIATAQKLTGLGDEVSSIQATVDSIDNLDSTQAAIKNKLGENKADVTSSQANVEEAVTSLESVKTVSIIGFVAAVIAAGVITFLIMLVIVRERRREIGVLKAIGGSNRTIVSQFMVEGMVLVALGALVGTGFALVSSNGIANALVSSNTNSSSQSDGPTTNFTSRGGGGPRRIMFGGPDAVNSTSSLVKNVTTQVGVTTLLYGLLAAFVIGIVGSGIPAWFIAKIRPAEVMRGE